MIKQTTSLGGRPLEALDLAVYREITTYAFNGPQAFPSQARIADAVGVSQPTVSRSITRLVKAGKLAVEKVRSVGSRYEHNVYTLLWFWNPVHRIKTLRKVDMFGRFNGAVNRKRTARPRKGLTRGWSASTRRLTTYDSAGGLGSYEDHAAADWEIWREENGIKAFA